MGDTWANASATSNSPLLSVAFGQRPPKKIANLPEDYLQELQSGGTCIQAYPVRVISVDREELVSCTEGEL
jgi:hypothetical protein